MTTFSVKPAALTGIAATVGEQSDRAEAAKARFAGSAAVSNVGSGMFPADEVEAEYGDAIKGLQNQLAELALSLIAWQRGFVASAAAYGGADTGAAASIAGTSTTTPAS